jgi:hypothetical protein
MCTGFNKVITSVTGRKMSEIYKNNQHRMNRTISLIGCGASEAYAPGPDEEDEEHRMKVTLHSLVSQEKLVRTLQ